MIGIPSMPFRLALSPVLVDIGGLADLAYLDRADEVFEAAPLELAD